ncbi:MAG: hypothetical protein QM689_01530 [Oscillospiraceae bacterium]
MSNQKKNKFQKACEPMKNLNVLSPEEREVAEAKREYQRRWRAANKDKVKEHNHRFYAKQAAKLKTQKETA